MCVILRLWVPPEIAHVSRKRSVFSLLSLPELTATHVQCLILHKHWYWYILVHVHVQYITPIYLTLCILCSVQVQSGVQSHSKEHDCVLTIMCYTMSCIMHQSLKRDGKVLLIISTVLYHSSIYTCTTTTLQDDTYLHITLCTGYENKIGGTVHDYIYNMSVHVHACVYVCVLCIQYIL